MKRIIVVFLLAAVFVLTLTAIPATISADPDAGVEMNVNPGESGCTTTIKLHAWNADGTPVLVWVFKFSGSWEDLLKIGMETDGKGVLNPIPAYVDRGSLWDAITRG